MLRGSVHDSTGDLSGCPLTQSSARRIRPCTDTSDLPAAQLRDRQPRTGAIHLWSISLQPLEGELRHLDLLLDTEEQARRDRLRCDLRSRFVAAHGAVRQILGWYTGTAAGSVRFRYTLHGKPGLDDPRLRFNMSHSVDLAVCAVGIAQIGVDIEMVRPVPDRDALVRRHFAAAEARAYDNLRDSDRTRAFLTMWTCKEAVLKATGEGLYRPLETVEVTSDTGGPMIVRIDGRCTAWSLQLFEPRAGYVGAVAHEGPVELLQRTWNSGTESEGIDGAVSRVVLM
jgi:4'-phosphopantetheinyl transferase